MERYWSRFADDLDERESYVAGEEVIAAVVQKLGEQKKTGRVLELGCGTGTYTEKVFLGMQLTPVGTIYSFPWWKIILKT